MFVISNWESPPPGDCVRFRPRIETANQPAISFAICERTWRVEVTGLRRPDDRTGRTGIGRRPLRRNGRGRNRRPRHVRPHRRRGEARLRRRLAGGTHSRRAAGPRRRGHRHRRMRSVGSVGLSDAVAPDVRRRSAPLIRCRPGERRRRPCVRLLKGVRGGGRSALATPDPPSRPRRHRGPSRLRPPRGRRRVRVPDRARA